jgi:hypothetical protein
MCEQDEKSRVSAELSEAQDCIEDLLARLRVEEGHTAALLASAAASMSVTVSARSPDIAAADDDRAQGELVSAL